MDNGGINLTNSIHNGGVKSIDTDLFDDTIVAFRTAITQYRDVREGIFLSMDRLIQTWEGEGEIAFEKAYKILKTKLKDEEDNLRTIAENLEDMRQSYRDWDASIASQFEGNS